MKYVVKITFVNGFVQKFSLPFEPDSACLNALVNSSMNYSMLSVVSASVSHNKKILYSYDY